MTTHTAAICFADIDNMQNNIARRHSKNQKCATKNLTLDSGSVENNIL